MVVAGGSAAGTDFYGNDLYRYRISNFCTFHQYRLGDLMSSPYFRSQHGTPAAGGRVGHDKTAVLHRTQHRYLRTQYTVGKCIYHQSVLCHYKLLSRNQIL